MFFWSYTGEKNIENALLDVSEDMTVQKNLNKENQANELLTPTKDMLLHKAVKNNPLLHIINSKGKCFCICGHDYINEVWQLVRILCAVYA